MVTDSRAPRWCVNTHKITSSSTRHTPNFLFNKLHSKHLMVSFCCLSLLMIIFIYKCKFLVVKSRRKGKKSQLQESSSIFIFRHIKFAPKLAVSELARFRQSIMIASSEAPQKHSTKVLKRCILFEFVFRFTNITHRFFFFFTPYSSHKRATEKTDSTFLISSSF